jgi:hypothetical protein
MNNLIVVCCIGTLTIMLLLFMVPQLSRRLFGKQLAQDSGSQPNPLTPTYNNPNIQSQSSFGRRGVFGNLRPTYNDPKIQGQGSFERILTLPGRRSSKSGGEQSDRIDSDHDQGQGSFGRDKRD